MDPPLLRLVTHLQAKNALYDMLALVVEFNPPYELFRLITNARSMFTLPMLQQVFERPGT